MSVVSVLNAQIEDRKRLQKELHSLAGGNLATLRLLLSMPLMGDHSWVERQAQCVEILDGLVDQVREIAMRVRSPLLDDFGLIPALLDIFETVDQKNGIKVDFTTNGIELSSCKIRESVIYQIVQDGVSNVAQHSGSSRVQIALGCDKEYLTVYMEDDGVGFNVKKRLKDALCMGLRGMESRVELLGGVIQIDSQIGSGTAIRAALPLK